MLLLILGKAVHKANQLLWNFQMVHAIAEVRGFIPATGTMNTGDIRYNARNCNEAVTTKLNHIYNQKPANDGKHMHEKVTEEDKIKN